MNKAEKIICNHMSLFINDNFDHIVYDVTDSQLPNDKHKFVNKIKKDPQLAMWCLAELCDWGMDKKFLKEVFFYEDPDYNFKVLKINDFYIKIEYMIGDDVYKMTLTEPKTKTVTYFE